jgi:hypothetical protein
MALAVVLLGWLVERWIVTDAEAIEALLTDAAAAFDEADFVRLGELLDEEFTQDRAPRDKALERLAALVKRFEPKGTSVSSSHLVVEGDAAKARVHVRVRALGQVLPLAGDVRFRRDAEGVWRVLAADGFSPNLR